MKNIIYLVSLVFFIVIGFFFINYVRNQPLSLNSRADFSATCSRSGFYDLNASSFGQVIFDDLKNNFCKTLNDINLYTYGGGYGTNAICYSKTKICTTNPNCINESCMICLNERTDPNNCVNAGVAPKNIVTREKNCPEDGKLKYGWAGPGDTCYSVGGGVKYTSGGEPYCGNKAVDKSSCCNNASQPNLFIARVCCSLGSTDSRCQTSTTTSGSSTSQKIVAKSCVQMGGNWYKSSNYYPNGFASCKVLSDKTGTPFADPSQTPSDKNNWNKYICCVPKKISTPTPSLIPTKGP
jgi:hypothetical protein